MSTAFASCARAVSSGSVRAGARSAPVLGPAVEEPGVAGAPWSVDVDGWVPVMVGCLLGAGVATWHDGPVAPRPTLPPGAPVRRGSAPSARAPGAVLEVPVLGVGGV